MSLFTSASPTPYGGYPFGVPPIRFPSRGDPDVEAAAAAERRRLRQARGRASTILTGGRGDPAPAPAYGKRLLGE